MTWGTHINKAGTFYTCETPLGTVFVTQSHDGWRAFLNQSFNTLVIQRPTAQEAQQAALAALGQRAANTLDILTRNR